MSTHGISKTLLDTVRKFYGLNEDSPMYNDLPLELRIHGFAALFQMCEHYGKGIDKGYTDFHWRKRAQPLDKEYERFQKVYPDETASIDAFKRAVEQLVPCMYAWAGKTGVEGIYVFDDFDFINMLSLYEQGGLHYNMDIHQYSIGEK